MISSEFQNFEHVSGGEADEHFGVSRGSRAQSCGDSEPARQGCGIVRREHTIGEPYIG
jgi:hypothetical protein